MSSIKKERLNLNKKKKSLRLQELKEQKLRDAKIAEEIRIKNENERIKEWELKFDQEQKKKEEELIKKFNEEKKRKKKRKKKLKINILIN